MAPRAGSNDRWSQPKRWANGDPYISLLTTTSTASVVTAATTERISATWAVQMVALSMSVGTSQRMPVATTLPSEACSALSQATRSVRLTLS